MPVNMEKLDKHESIFPRTSDKICHTRRRIMSKGTNTIRSPLTPIKKEKTLPRLRRSERGRWGCRRGRPLRRASPGSSRRTSPRRSPGTRTSASPLLQLHFPTSSPATACSDRCSDRRSGEGWELEGPSSSLLVFFALALPLFLPTFHPVSQLYLSRCLCNVAQMAWTNQIPGIAS